MRYRPERVCVILGFFPSEHLCHSAQSPQIFLSPELRQNSLGQIIQMQKRCSKWIKKNFKWTRGFIFSLFISVDLFASFGGCIKLYNAATSLSKLVCKYSLFHLRPSPMTDGNCSKTSTWVVNYGKLSYLFLFVTAG